MREIFVTTDLAYSQRRTTIGLTIHYSVKAPATWSLKIVREKLERLRQFAMDLPVVEVSAMKEFHGKECGFQKNRKDDHKETDEENDDRWLKIQSARSVDSPYEPGSSASQPARHLIAFTVFIAPGSEPMNIGYAAFSKFVWKPHFNPKAKDEERRGGPASWFWIFEKRNRHPESAKIMRAFLTKWHLRKVAKMPADYHDWANVQLLYRDELVDVSIRKGPYVSHRRGYLRQFGLVRLRNLYPTREPWLFFRHTGTDEEARKDFCQPKFMKELLEIVRGKPVATPAERGSWGSFTKTQYANDPRCGGWINFKRAHLSVCAILEKARQLGFVVHVRDEGHYWETRDLTVLAKNLGEYDRLIAGGNLIFGEIAAAAGVGLESAMAGRSDLEHLEAEGLAKLPMLEHLRQVGEELKKYVREKKEACESSAEPGRGDAVAD